MDRDEARQAAALRVLVAQRVARALRRGERHVHVGAGADQIIVDVLLVLKTACYDCHSNNTVYPWYNTIQPIAWWLNRHVVEGKQHLDFSDIGNYTAKKAKHKLDEVAEVLEKDEMPLFSYTIIHRNAKLNDAQKQLLINWAKNATVATLTN